MKKLVIGPEKDHLAFVFMVIGLLLILFPAQLTIFRAVIIVLSTALAIMPLFNPFAHFTTHVRILGLEIILCVLVRRHKILTAAKAEDRQ